MSHADCRAAAQAPRRRKHRGAFGRRALVALMAFLTLVDLFATQAILPSLARALPRQRRRRWAWPSTPAPSAWRSPALRSHCSGAASIAGAASR